MRTGPHWPIIQKLVFTWAILIAAWLSRQWQDVLPSTLGSSALISASVIFPFLFLPSCLPRPGNLSPAWQDLPKNTSERAVAVHRTRQNGPTPFWLKPVDDYSRRVFKKILPAIRGPGDDFSRRAGPHRLMRGGRDDDVVFCGKESGAVLIHSVRMLPDL
jgi:hypothetical protein